MHDLSGLSHSFNCKKCDEIIGGIPKEMKGKNDAIRYAKSMTDAFCEKCGIEGQIIRVRKVKHGEAKDV